MIVNEDDWSQLPLWDSDSKVVYRGLKSLDRVKLGNRFNSKEENLENLTLHDRCRLILRLPSSSKGPVFAIHLSAEINALSLVSRSPPHPYSGSFSIRFSDTDDLQFCISEDMGKT